MLRERRDLRHNTRICSGLIHFLKVVICCKPRSLWHWLIHTICSCKLIRILEGINSGFTLELKEVKRDRSILSILTTLQSLELQEVEDTKILNTILEFFIDLRNWTQKNGRIWHMKIVNASTSKQTFLEGKKTL